MRRERRSGIRMRNGEKRLRRREWKGGGMEKDKMERG
jgi:hypothetical protein